MTVHITKKSRNPSRDDEIVAHYRDGRSLKEVGAIFSISHERVRNILAGYEAKFQVTIRRQIARSEKIIWRCAGCGLERKMLASQAKHRQICSKCNSLNKVKYSDEIILAWISQRRSGKTWVEIALEAGFPKNHYTQVCRIVYGFLRRNNRLSEVAELWQGYSLRYLAPHFPKDFWLKEDLDDGRKTRRQNENRSIRQTETV